MKVISHRGNLTGPNSVDENSPSDIDQALSIGFDCEIDIWCDPKGNLRLGHDSGEFHIDLNWLLLRSSKLWIHCKNFLALEYFSRREEKLNFFWHQSDDHVLTSSGIIWSYPGQPLSSRAVVVLPENHPQLEEIVLENAFAICTDYPIKFDEELNRSTLR